MKSKMNLYFVTAHRAELSTTLPLFLSLYDDPRINPKIFIFGFQSKISINNLLKSNPLARKYIYIGPIANTKRDLYQNFNKMMTKGFEWLWNQITDVDYLVITGDRPEMLQIGYFATAFQKKIVHVSGGDTTTFVVDQKIRTAISSLSDLHLVSLPQHKHNLVKLGIPKQYIRVIGDPGLWNLKNKIFLDFDKLKAKLKIVKGLKVVLLNYHPYGNNLTIIYKELNKIFDVLKKYNINLLVSHPNGDYYSKEIEALMSLRIREFHNAKFLDVSQQEYYSVLSFSDLFIGNSSSGIWEAPSFNLPSIIVGLRQKGRFMPASVIYIENQFSQLEFAVDKILSSRKKKATISNPYEKKIDPKNVLNFILKYKL